MERFTNRFSNGEAFIPNYVSDLYGKGKVAEKLAHYEDLEEQGRLIELPCKVGDIVYSLEYGKIIERTVDLFEVWENSLWCFEKNHIIIGGIGSTVFATKEEAEQALAEMKGE